MKIVADATDFRPHWPQALLQKPMVSLDTVGAVAAGPMSNARHCRGQRRRVRGGLVSDDVTRHCPAGSDGALEEPARSYRVARWRHVCIDNLTTPIHSSIDVVPTAADPSVGLVDSPVGTQRRAVLARHLAEQREEALYPAVDGALVDQDAALGQPFSDFGVTEAVAHVPTDSQDDNLVRKGATRKRRSRAPGEAPTTVATAETLSAELSGPVLGHDHRPTARARHQPVLPRSAYPTQSPAREAERPPATAGTAP